MSEQTTFRKTLEEQLGQVGNYVNDLRKEAQGDFNFITQFLDKQHKIALGSNDQVRAEFFEQVSNELEKQVGRIPFDFQQRTEREKADLQDFLQAQELETQDLLKREKQFAQQQTFTQGIEEQQRREEFNRRGLLGSGIEKKREEQQRRQRELFETQPFQRGAELERGRRELATERGQLESVRRLEDITTGARRGAQDTELSIDRQREGAQRDLDKRLAAIRREQVQTEDRIKELALQREELSIAGL
jgi:hypothetical protein